MDFGAGDIAAGIKLCVYLYQYGFSTDNAADVRFINFQNDVHNFASLLETLDNSIKKAHHRYTTKLALDRAPLDALDHDFDSERKAIVGNFDDTLEECKTFLHQRRKYTTHHSNPLENITWHLMQEEQRVNDLRQRIAFHTSKIRFVIDRLSVEILSDLDANVEDTRALAEENLDVSNDILYEVTKFRSELFGYLAGQARLSAPSSDDRHLASPAIAERFQEGLKADSANKAGPDIPLKEGFDALLQALEQSNEGSDQTPEKYLAFIKARWLMGKIQRSAEYRNARPGFYFKRATKQIEKALKTRLRSPEGLIQYDEESLLALPSTCFTIWKLTATPISNELDMQLALPRGDEVEIAMIELATDVPGRTDKLTVLKRSDVQFRAVREVTSSSSNNQVVLPLQIDIREDNLVPRYLLPTLSKPCLEMSVLSRDVENSFRFQSLEDLHGLQSALTGFEISHDQSSVISQFSSAVKHLDCTARIQLWQEPLDTQNAEQTASPTGPGSAAANSNSHAGTRVSVAATNTVVQTTDGFEAQSIKRCAIAFFSEVRNHAEGQRFAITFIALPEDSHIDETLCSCRGDYDNCSKLVIVRKKKRALAVRYRYCDLSSFDLLEFRLNSNFKKASEGETEYVMLKFASLAEKKQFHRELNLRFAVRSAQIEDQYGFGERFRRRQDHPQRLDQASHQTNRRRSSNLASPTLAQSWIPQLPAIDSGPSLSSSPSRGQGTSSLEIPVRSQVPSPNPAQGASPAIAGTDSDSAIDLIDLEKPKISTTAHRSTRPAPAPNFPRSVPIRVPPRSDMSELEKWDAPVSFHVQAAREDSFASDRATVPAAIPNQTRGWRRTLKALRPQR